jgi:predicted transcriptional regulator
MTTERIKTIAYLQAKDRAGLDQLSEKTGATVSKLIERAVQQYLKKEGK